MKCSLGISNFLEEISSLSHSIVFLCLHWSLRKAFLSLLAIFWNSAFKWVYLSSSPLLFASLLFTAICKASSDSHFAFLHFFFLGMVLIPVSCTMSRTSIHGSLGTLSIRSSPLRIKWLVQGSKSDCSLYALDGLLCFSLREPWKGVGEVHLHHQNFPSSSFCGCHRSPHSSEINNRKAVSGMRGTSRK